MKLITMVLLLSFYKCESYERYVVYVENKANYSIGCYFALGGDSGTVYPDTMLPISNLYVAKEIKANSTYFKYSGIKWEEIFEELPQDTLSVFIFHTDTLKKYSWEEIRDDYKILKRYDLSLEDLEETDFMITYP